jgi:hypothetical protein
VCRLRAQSWATATAEVAQQARDRARHTLAEWAVQDPGDQVALIVDELVTNAVRHSGPPVELVVAVADGVLDLSITDHGPASRRTPYRRRSPKASTRRRPAGAVLLTDAPGASNVPPVIFSDASPDAPWLSPRRPALAKPRGLTAGQPPEGLASDGRGLFVVDALCDSWGLLPTSTGTRAWVRRSLGGRWPYQPSCRCSPAHPFAVPLASGHVAVPAPLTVAGAAGPAR